MRRGYWKTADLCCCDRAKGDSRGFGGGEGEYMYDFVLSVRGLQDFYLSDVHIGPQLGEEMKTRVTGLEDIYAQMMVKVLDMDETDCGGSGRRTAG